MVQQLILFLAVLAIFSHTFTDRTPISIIFQILLCKFLHCYPISCIPLKLVLVLITSAPFLLFVFIQPSCHLQDLHFFTSQTIVFLNPTQISGRKTREGSDKFCNICVPTHSQLRPMFQLVYSSINNIELFLIIGLSISLITLVYTKIYQVKEQMDTTNHLIKTKSTRVYLGQSKCLLLLCFLGVLSVSFSISPWTFLQINWLSRPRDKYIGHKPTVEL